MLELATAALVVFPATQTAGLFIGAIIMAAAAFTVVRHRGFLHLVLSVSLLLASWQRVSRRSIGAQPS